VPSTEREMGLNTVQPGLPGSSFAWVCGLGAHQTSVYLGAIAGGFFAGWIGQAYGWPFYVFGASGIPLGFVLHRALREPRRGQADGETQPVKLPFSNVLRIVWTTLAAPALMGAFLCAKFVAVVLVSGMPKFIHDRFGLDLAASGLTAAAGLRYTVGWLGGGGSAPLVIGAYAGGDPTCAA
jgi:hypothetical protein